MSTPLPPVANAIKATQNWHIGGNLLAENVYHFLVSGGPPSASTCQGLAAGIQAASVTDFKTNTHSSVSIGQVTVQDISSSTGADGVGGTVTAGTLGGTFLGASISVVVAHKVARRFRGGHYRSYLPVGSSSSTSTNGSWSTAITTSFQADYVDWVTNCLAVTSGGCAITSFVGVSYYHSGSLRGTPVVDTIQQSICRARMGSQRRRLKTA